MDKIDDSIGLRPLRALVAVADARSFRGAAAALGYTQSAVSHQIAQLESALGTPLLTRPGGRAPTALTPAGETAYRHARRALEAVESMGADVRAIHSERGTLRMGIFQAAVTALLPATLAAYRRERPNVSVILSEPKQHRSLVQALAQGELDLAVTINPEPDDRVEAIALLDDPWVMLTREDSELARAPEPGFELLDGAPVIAWQAGWPNQAAARGRLAQARDRAARHLPHRRQPRPAAARRRRPGVRLRRAPRRRDPDRSRPARADPARRHRAPHRRARLSPAPPAPRRRATP